MTGVDVVVVGGSFAGLLAAVQLARAGREVTVVEQDLGLLLAADGAAPRAPRPGAPHAVHGHAMLSRGLKELRAGVPDVVEELIARGAIEHRLPEHFPPSAGSLPAAAGDAELVMLFCGRHLLDRVIVDVAASTPGLTLREGRVEGVEVRAAQHSEPARAVGVRLDSGEPLRAELVLDAGGRRSRVPSFLAAIGAKPDVVEHDCPLIYYSRHYRFLGTQRPPLNRLFAAGGFIPSLV